MVKYFHSVFPQFDISERAPVVFLRMAGVVRSLGTPAFLAGVGVGVAGAALYSRLFCQQLPDILPGEEEDGDSACELSFLLPFENMHSFSDFDQFF